MSPFSGWFTHRVTLAPLAQMSWVCVEDLKVSGPNPVAAPLGVPVVTCARSSDFPAVSASKDLYCHFHLRALNRQWVKSCIHNTSSYSGKMLTKTMGVLLCKPCLAFHTLATMSPGLFAHIYVHGYNQWLLRLLPLESDTAVPLMSGARQTRPTPLCGCWTHSCPSLLGSPL